MYNPNAMIAKEIADILSKSATANLGDSTKLILSYNIADYITAHYELKPRKAWYGIDIWKKINELRQQLAIAYIYAKKEGICKPQPKEKQLNLTLY